MKAVVMAGGEGTRLRPMTSNLPKPLLTVGDRPVMEHVLQLLKRHGIKDVVVTVQFLASLIKNYFGDGSELGINLMYAHEEQPLGTAGSVKNAEKALDGEPFVVVSGDALTDFDLTDAIRYHRQKGALVTVCLTRVPDPLEFGITVLDNTGRVERFLEKPTWGQVFTDTVNTGIYIMEPEVLGYVADDEPVDWSGDVFPQLLANGQPIYGYVADGYWEDIGSHDSYVKAQADLLDGKVRIEQTGFEMAPGIRVGEGAEIHPEAVLTGPLTIGPYTRIEAKAEIGPHTVIGRGSVVAARAVVERAVLHQNVYIGPGASLNACVVGRGTAVMRGARLEPAVVIGDNCTIGDGSIIASGVRVYPSKTIEDGARVNASVVWESRGQAQLFGPRGVGGILNVDITPELAVRLISAYASTLKKGDSVALASDHSRGARALAQCMASALQTGAIHVQDLRTVTMPVLRQQSSRGAAGGIYVRTAPGLPESVEILFVDQTGADFSDAAKRKLDRVYARQDYRRAFPGEIGAITHPTDAVGSYAQSLIDALDFDRVAHSGIKIVIDVAHGTVSHILPDLIGQLGIEVLVVNAGIDDTHPTETNDERVEALARLGQLVRSSQADFGARFDPIGERLTLVNDLGETVDDARAVLIQLALAMRHHHGGSVVLPVTVSRTAEHLAAAYGGRVKWASTSPAALAKAAEAPEVIFAGDGAGGYILPGTGAPFDGAAALVCLVSHLAGSYESLSHIEAQIPQDQVLQREIPTPWSVKGVVMRHIAEAGGEHVLDTTADGVRIIEPDGGWALVLPDQAQAITRVYAEGGSQRDSQRLLAKWADRVVEAAS
ncbi:sugar phosphate nucleotidyltransferase [Streptomyces sp. H27-C3]|uniref:sugar phosphate nucleotidyltransferase n=1 Tax=Streptomyces sp. H27-C3 TaxID=3046305 RepID=UPI0024B9D37D|nr:sugar phosphate nucleotidyltransferase [Streptomyces sp. H27-C3]MDJ0466564.1 sugar phosphate nucleotidyltransferase [Streptomyces sp. H27-C3]